MSLPYVEIPYRILDMIIDVKTVSISFSDCFLRMRSLMMQRFERRSFSCEFETADLLEVDT